jgi:transposase-like protein
MTAKRTHKLKGLKNVAEVVATSRSLSEAAQKLGVNRSSLHRWMQAGKVAAPAPKMGIAAGVQPGQTAEDWAKAVREAGDLDATRSALVDLAVEALTISRDTEHRPETRLSAMGRYQQLVKQLNLDNVEPAAAKVPTMNPARIARTGTDPRNILMAVK